LRDDLGDGSPGEDDVRQSVFVVIADTAQGLEEFLRQVGQHVLKLIEHKGDAPMGAGRLRLAEQYLQHGFQVTQANVRDQRVLPIVQLVVGILECFLVFLGETGEWVEGLVQPVGHDLVTGP